MNALLKSFLTVAVGAFIVGGCGSSNDDPSSLIEPKLYEGAVSAGDFVEAKFDPSNNQLDYTLSGSFADKYNIHSGSFKLVNMFGNFYKYGDDELIFFASNNLSVAHVELDGQGFNFATLSDIDTPTSEDLVDKTFNAGVFLNGENPDICKISFAKNDVTFGPCIKNNYIEQFSWQIEDKKLVFKNETDIVAQGILKKGDRDSLIVDLINLSGYSGMAISLENKPLTATDADNVDVFKAMDISPYDISFSETEIVNKDGVVYANVNDLDSNGKIEYTYQVSLKLNPTINSEQWNGLAQVEGRDAQFALFSKEDGFYLSINVEPDYTNPYILSFGSNIPLK